MPAHRSPCTWIRTAHGTHCSGCGRPYPREDVVVRVLPASVWPAFVICDLRARQRADVPALLAGPFPTLAAVRQTLPGYLRSDARPCCLSGVDEAVFRLLRDGGPVARAFLAVMSTQHYRPDGTPVTCCERAEIRRHLLASLDRALTAGSVGVGAGVVVGELVGEGVPA